MRRRGIALVHLVSEKGCFLSFLGDVYNHARVLPITRLRQRGYPLYDSRVGRADDTDGVLVCELR